MSQDLHFSQFFNAPLLRNPALAGIFTGDYRIQGVYRDQWNSLTNAYRTGSFNGEYKLPVGKTDDFLIMGLQVLYDKAGSAGLTSTQVFPALNYNKSLSNTHASYLSLGFMGGYVEKLTFQKLQPTVSLTVLPSTPHWEPARVSLRPILTTGMPVSA
jgi:hypothetical protein